MACFPTAEFAEQWIEVVRLFADAVGKAAADHATGQETLENRDTIIGHYAKRGNKQSRTLIS